MTMKFNSFKKIIPSLLIIVIIYGLTITPKKADAVVTTVIETGPSLFQQIVNTINTTATAFSTYSIQFKEYVLDPLASGLAKFIIRNLTQSVVQWINGGFEGSPSFITNPSTFFLDLADQVTGDFLAKVGGPLADLCSPFSIDLRIALAFKYHPRGDQQRYKCTLGLIIANSKNAVKGASINGFTAGDFSQGGWPAFVSLTTEPQNNIYGAYLGAESELSLRVAGLQLQKTKQLDQGNGFLSWQDPSCLKNIKERNELQSQEEEYNIEGKRDEYDSKLEGYNSTLSKAGANAYRSGPVTRSDCPVKTPGSVIVNSLNESVAGPLRELELADEINEILTALASQLVTQVLTKGLSAVSGSGPSDSTAYINQVAAEKNPNLKKIVDKMLSNLSKYITDTEKYKENKEESLQIALSVKASFDSVKACYSTKITTGGLTPTQIAYAQAEIASVDSAIASGIGPIASKLLRESQEADKRLQILLDIQVKTTAAQTVNDVRDPSDEFALLLLNQELTSPKDLVDSKEEIKDIKDETKSMKKDAERRSQACTLFPFGVI